MVVESVRGEVKLSDSIVHATVRLSVDGPSGRIDIAAPLWSDISSLGAAYGEEVGESERFTFATSTGVILDPATTVQQAGLRHGDVVVALPQTREGFEATSFLDRNSLLALTSPPKTHHAPAFTPWVAAAAAILAATVASSLGYGTPRLICAGLLAVLAAVIPLLTLLRDDNTFAWATVCPLFAAAAAVAAVSSNRAGGTLLVAGACGLATATGAAYSRTLSSRRTDDPLLVWLWAGLAVAAISTATLLIGASTGAMWAIFLVVSVAVSRLLPALVIDVPDDLLIDFTRLAKTAWSAREEPRKRRRGLIRREDVENLAHGGQSLVVAASVAVVLAALVSAVALEFTVEDRTATIGAHIMTIATGVAFALGSRSFRSRPTRFLMRVAGALILIVGVTRLMIDVDTTRLPLLAIGAITAGSLTAVAAAALGRGWHSLRWSRSAEIFDGLSVVVVVAGLPLATGLFTFVRQLSF